MEVGRGPMEKQISLTQSDQNIAGAEMRRELNNEQIDNGRTGLVGSLPYNVSARDSNMAAKSYHKTNTSTNIAAKLDHRTITTTNMIDKSDPTANAAANMVGKPDPRVDSAENVASKSDLRTNRTTDATVDMDADPEIRTKESKKLISTASVSQWTDEQLLELFADYQDGC